jgi:hypothetical protein
MGPSLFRLLPWREEGPTRKQGEEVRDAISQNITNHHQTWGLWHWFFHLPGTALTIFFEANTVMPAGICDVVIPV